MCGVDQALGASLLPELAGHPDGLGTVLVEVGVDHVAVRADEGIHARKSNIQVVAEHDMHDRDVGARVSGQHCGQHQRKACCPDHQGPHRARHAW